MASGRYLGLLSAALAFLLSLVFSDVISAELARYGINVRDIIRKNVLNPVFGPPGVELLPVDQPKYSVDLANAYPTYRRSNVSRVFKMYTARPASFRFEPRQRDEDVHCWPQSAEDRSVAIAFMHIRAERAQLDFSSADDAVICTTVNENMLSWETGDEYKSGLGCPRMGCPTSVYFRDGGVWRLVFDTPYCTAVYFVDTSRLGVKDLMCTGFENQIYHWSGSRFTLSG